MYNNSKNILTFLRVCLGVVLLLSQVFFCEKTFIYLRPNDRMSGMLFRHRQDEHYYVVNVFVLMNLKCKCYESKNVY